MFTDPDGLIVRDAWDYTKRSGDQLIRGNYSDEVTLLGTGAQIGTGLLGLDLPGDIRDITYDLTNWEWSWGHAGQTTFDAIGILPVIGALKYADETGTLLKGVNKVDEIADASKKVDINLKYKNGWTDAQKAAADSKVKALTNADTRVVKSPARSGTTQSRYRKDTGLDSSMDADHTIDLQVGGADDFSNMSGLDKSVNRSIGSQIQQKTKSLPENTIFDKFTID